MKSENFWIVGIGASAGGLEALTTFFKALDGTPNAAFVIAQHLAPHSKSMMVELLSRHTKLPVIQVKDKLELEPGVISIVPPNYDVMVVDGELRLSRAGNETRPKPSVDILLESLAQVHKKRAIGIILSGTGSDGADGIRAIKENGGMTFAQDSEDAKYDGMPKAAIETGLVDAVLPAERLAKNLFDLIAEKGKVADPPKKLNKEDTVDFKVILKYLKDQSGADFSQYKISTIQRRIEKRLSVLKLNTLAEYYNYLLETPSELGHLSQNLLVSVTAFYRDPEAWEELAKQLEEMILEKKTGEVLRVWSAGCATGEEPYTLAFLISDILERTGKMISVKIFATDLDHEALAIARSGMYSSDDVKGLSKEDLDKYFEKKEKYFVVKKPIRDWIVFARQDLIQNPPFVKTDLIACRNVLIYFEAKLQSKIFEIFHYALKPNGILFLGKSESINNNLFEVVSKKQKIFRRMNVVSKFTQAGRYSVGPHLQATFDKKKISTTKIMEEAPLLILKQFEIAGAIVDEDSTILHLIGDVSQFISLPTGQPDFRLSNLMHKDANVEFTIFIKKAQKEDKTFKSRKYPLNSHSKKFFTFSIKALPKEEEATKQLFLVSFEVTKESKPHTPIHPDDPAYASKLLELEQEVSVTKENLQTVIEELEVSNEELQSLNEELSSANEELQASNEELETTNEELQSTNEELMTLNEELNIKSSELRSAYLSLDNIQTSITFPLVVIDNGMKIQRYNSSSHLVFNISVSDIGTPITRTSCHCEIPNFEEKIRDTLITGKVTESVCEANGRIFQLRVHPSRDENKKIIGAILVFFDNTEVIQASDKLKMTDKRLRSIIDGSPTLISLKDTQGRYLTANAAFCELLGKKEEEILGKTDRELFSEENYAYLREQDLEVLLKRKSSEKEDRMMIKGKEYYFRTNRFPLFGLNDRSPYAIGIVSLDVTKQVTNQHELEASESRYRAMIEEQAVFICRQSTDGKILYGNNSFVRYFGDFRTNPDLNFYSLINTRDQARTQSELSKVSFDIPITQFEVRMVTDGSERWVRWIVRGIFNDRHDLLEFQSVGFDVTEIHNKTSELLAKENLYTHVLEYTSDYLSVYRCENEKFYLESFNQSAAYYRGFGSQRLIGKELTELQDPSQVANVLARFKRSVENNTIDTFEETIVGPAGALYLSTTIVPIYDSTQDVTRVAGLSRDITKLKRTEKALRDEKVRAESANLAKSDFLASMSHELRTPLNVIMGMSQLLLRGKLDDKNSRLVESIQRSSKVLLSLIEDVLDLSKIEAGKVNFNSKPFDLDQLTQDVIQSFESEAQKKKIKLKREFKVKPNVPLIGDEIRIKQIIINLLGNAIKFTDKGSVELSVSLQGKGQDRSRIYFEVRDTGIGIPEEAFPKIFNRFSQADSGTARKYGGTGLGLAISKQLVELMQGTIGFSSEVGKGSTFWFEIEFSEAVHDLQEDIGEASKELDYSNLKILTVDDNPESLKVLQYYFEERKADFEFAESGQEAIEKVARSKYDIVLMDMQMPGMDGLTATRKIRETISRDIPIVALTANAMDSDREKCLESGMNDFLTKPVDFETLNKIIKKWVNHEHH